MSLINPKKQYKKLLACGCSYTEGAHYTINGSWASSLSKRLNCELISNGFGGSSNYIILSQVLSYCESNDMTDVCVGVQWSQPVRREIWNDKDKIYNVINCEIFEGNLSSVKWADIEDKNLFIDNESFFNSIWWDYQENILRTIHCMILLKNYLISKKIDFIMFEGLGSIMDYDSEFMTELIKNWNPFLVLYNNDIRKRILEDVTFFSDLGTMDSAMRKRDDFDNDENGGHPTPPICEWWADELMKYTNRIHDSQIQI